VILVDTLRADHLRTYGYHRPTSPRLDALAADGIVFERAYSTSNWTRPALASLHTSTMPARHGMARVNHGVPPSLPLLAESLHARGYQTGMVVIGGNFGPGDGYDRGVDFFWVARRPLSPLLRSSVLNDFVFRDFPSANRLIPAPPLDYDSESPEVITDKALEFVRGADPARPVFVFAHYLGPHDPYAPAAPFDRSFGASGVDLRVADPPKNRWAGPDALSPADRQKMIDQYDEEILWNDRSIGRLIDGLRDTGRLDDAIVIVTADHGEGFGEHGVWAHNFGLFDEIVRIPLVVWSSAPMGGAPRLHVPVSLLDLAPTMLELSGTPRPASFDGESLLPWLRGERTSVDRVVHTENSRNGELGAHSAEWAYFQETGSQRARRWLYRADDRRQESDLSAQEAQTAAAMAALVRERFSQDLARHTGTPQIELDPDQREQFRQLGYIE
jgi:arylsulfatase A-like enzyme